MRMRHLAAAGAVAWLGLVVVVAAVSDVDIPVAVLLGALGLLAVASLVVGLTACRTLARQRTVSTPTRRPAPGAPAVTAAGVERVVTKVVTRELRRTFRQVEALQNLYAMLPIEHALPASRGFPASPDLLLFLADLVDRHRPRVVVECGSGLSTLCLGLALRRFGVDGRVVALEHLEQYAEQTDDLLRRHGLADVAEVRLAPLQELAFGDEKIPWYPATAWSDLAGIGLLLVDGPPADLHPLARYPALPSFLDRLAPGGRIVLDDYARPSERAILDRWVAEHPGRLDVRPVPLEKGAALVTLT